MPAIPHAAMALTSALDRFGHAGLRMLGAVTGAGGTPGEAIAEMAVAKTQVKAGVALVRFSDEMYKALLEIGREPSR